MQFFENETDENLCTLAKKGDIYAEEVLIKRYNKLVKSCSRPYFLIGADFEDLLQEGMLGLIKAIRQYDETKGASFSTFARVCILSSVYNAVKIAGSAKHIPLNSYISIEKPLFNDSEDRLFLSPLSLSDPESLVIGREEQTENTKRLMDNLSAFEALVLKLYLTGMSSREMAEQLQKSLKSIDNAVKRIKRKATELFPQKS